MEIAFDRLSKDANNWLTMQMDIFFVVKPHFKWVLIEEDGKTKFRVFANSKNNFLGIEQTYDPSDDEDKQGEFLLFANVGDMEADIAKAVEEYGWSVWEKTVEQQYLTWVKTGQWDCDCCASNKMKSVVRTLPFYGPSLYLVCARDLMLKKVPEEYVSEFLVAQTEKSENVIQLSHIRHTV